MSAETLPPLSPEEAASWMTIVRSLAEKWQSATAARVQPFDWTTLRDLMASFGEQLARGGARPQLALVEPTLDLVDTGPAALLDPVFMFDPARNAAFLDGLTTDLAALAAAVDTA